MDAENRRIADLQSPKAPEPPATNSGPHPLTTVQHIAIVLKVLGVAAVLGSLLWLVERFLA
jgi:hypothetical protein